MRATGAAIEIRARIAAIIRQRAAEGVLEEADVTLRRTDKHRDLVKRHTPARFLDDPPRNLDALAPFTRRREQLHVSRRLPYGRLRSREQVPAERDQVALARLLEQLAFQAERLQPIHRRDVAKRYGHERRGSMVEGRALLPGPRSSMSEQRFDEGELARRVDRHVEEQQTRWKLEAGGRSLAECSCRRLEQRRAVGGAGGRELLIETLEKHGEVGAPQGQGAQAIDGHVCEAELLQRAGERAREARGLRDRRKVLEGAVPLGLERRARGDRFGAEGGDRRQPLRGKHRSREARGELRETEPVEADGGAGRGRNRPGKIVDGAA